MTGPHKILECFESQQKTKAVAILFSLYIVRILPTFYFGYFGHVWLFPSKTIMPTLMFSYRQKMNSIPNLFFEIL